MNLMMRLKNDYLKFLAGLLVVLIVLEWSSGIRASFRLDAITTPTEAPSLKKGPKPEVVKQHVAIKVSLFGDYVPQDVSAAGVKRSSLDISVVGISFASDEKKSHVMLELPGHQVKLFGVGDMVPGGAMIKRITPEGILLLHDGGMESLSLPKNELQFSPPPDVLKQD